MHNVGVDTVLKRVSLPITAEDILDVAEPLLDSLYEAALEEEVDIPTIYIEDTSVLAIDVSVIVDTIKERMLNQQVESFTQEEFELLDEFEAIFEKDYSGMTVQEIGDTILSQANLLMEEINVNKETYPHDEFIAFMSVLQGSGEYWLNYFSPDGAYLPEPPDPPSGIWLFDAAGYLVGWVDAWLDDQGPNYSNEWPAQKRRIGEGLKEAGKWSIMRRFW